MTQLYGPMDLTITNLLEAFVAAEISKLQAQIGDAPALQSVKVQGVMNLTYLGADGKTNVPVVISFDLGTISSSATPTVIPANANQNLAIQSISVQAVPG